MLDEASKTGFQLMNPSVDQESGYTLEYVEPGTNSH